MATAIFFVDIKFGMVNLVSLPPNESQKPPRIPLASLYNILPDKKSSGNIGDCLRLELILFYFHICGVC